MADFENARGSMKFPGYWVSIGEGKILLEVTTFDETELDPATNWKLAWQNQAAESQVKGYVELESALIFTTTSLAKVARLPLTQADLDQATRFKPVWKDNRYEIQSLSHLLGSKTS